MNNFVTGINLIVKKEPLDYCFEHDIAYLNSIDNFDAYELNELYDLGFYIDDEHDCLVVYS